jgi:hypothetical protein
MSLEALTHATAAPAFNGLFFATVATVIPVLFLAIVLQANTYQALLLAYANEARAYRARIRAIKAADRLTIRLALAGAFDIHLPGILAAAILVAGIYGEGTVLVALYERQAVPGGGLGALIATLFLATAADSGPIGQYQQMIRRDRAEREREARAEREQALHGDGENGASPNPAGG